jgi:hypothetical protein
LFIIVIFIFFFDEFIKTKINTNYVIKEHVKNIQNNFSSGNFTRPFFIHAQDVPGTNIMSEEKNSIEYTINELSNGAELVLNTTDKELVDAIHQFIAYQNNAHQGH